VRTRWLVYFGMAMLAGALGGALLAPAPAEAVAREIVELQTSVNQLIAGQQALQTAMTQSDAVQKTLIEQSLDSVNKLSATMGSLQKSVQDMQASSGARLDSMSTQVQGVSDNLQELLARMGKLNQQLTDAQNAIQGIDAKLAAGSAPPPPTPAAPTAALSAPGPGGMPGPAGSAAGYAAGSGAPGASSAPPPAAAPSADLLYSNGLRDINGRKYDLAAQEFTDYLKYYPQTDLASNAQYYLGQIFYNQQEYEQSIDALSKVIDNYPKSFKLTQAHLLRGLALVALGDKSSGSRELRDVVRLYPGTDEERRARAKLQELGAGAAAK
jgi:tol-pal system protein YbgF